jgi:hypothetical protein
MKQHYAPVMPTPLSRSVLAAAFALSLAGCGSLTGSSPLEVNQRAAVEKVVYRQFAAYQTDNMKVAFSTLRKDCQRALGLSAYSSMVRADIAVVEDVVGARMSELELRDVDVDVSGGLVTFTSRVFLNDGTPASRPTGKYEVMVFEDGQWRFRECPTPRV